MRYRFLSALLVAVCLASIAAAAQEPTNSPEQVQQGPASGDPLPVLGASLVTAPLPMLPATLPTTSSLTRPTSESQGSTFPGMGAMYSMYAMYGTLQALDAHSTLKALDNNAIEGNPVVRTMSGSPAALVSFKAATSVGVLYFMERLRKKNQKAAFFLAIGVNSLQAYVVAHNYRAAKQ